jgi:fluoroquinolone resistance protein
MEIIIHDDKTFENIDFSENRVSKREFNNCKFLNCNFQKADLSSNDFVDCSFNNCNLSLAVLDNAGIKNIQFSDCKLMGIDFSKCSSFLFSASFKNCILDYSSFYQKKMKKTMFSDCSLKSVNFEETDVSFSIFNNCDLLNAVFIRSILEKADFRTARNYAFDPDLNKIRKAKFSFPAVAGLLDKYDIDIGIE